LRFAEFTGKTPLPCWNLERFQRSAKHVAISLKQSASYTLGGRCCFSGVLENFVAVVKPETFRQNTNVCV